MSAEKIKVLIAKPGLDGHDVGAKIIVRAMMEAGFDTVYSGLRRTPEDIVQLAKEEDVDVIGLSILSGSHMPLCRKMRELLIDAGMADKLWVVGGNIPKRDRLPLANLGFRGVF
ncbi:MAG TPA: methylmalonyl-CoA mutase, partial [Rhodospirillales bacterium]|nr:methylmalonyl-CoA mutase [Rhodospirillales bacterium]